MSRSVTGNILTSAEFPAIRVRVDPAFRYAGKFDFTIKGIARGERYVFVDSEGQSVKRLFIFQFEEYLPESKGTYNYNFTDALNLNGHPFKHGTYAYSNQETRRNDPNNEGALTADFLEKQGYLLEDELMMSRFVTVPDAERKHELILYYLENASPTGHRLNEFFTREEEATPIWKEIARELAERSFEYFEVLK